MFRVQRICAFSRPESSVDEVPGTTEWVPSPVLPRDRVVIATRLAKRGEGEGKGRAYVQIASNGILIFTENRPDASTFQLVSTTGEPDPLREQNEIYLYAEPLGIPEDKEGDETW